MTKAFPKTSFGAEQLLLTKPKVLMTKMVEDLLQLM